MYWHFRKTAPDETIRDPISSEFFSNDAIGNPSKALIRESIQNSLDAKKNSGIVKARIFLSSKQLALTEEAKQYWFKGMWSHVDIKGNGLSDKPNTLEPCEFLVFEDFGTSGLEGDEKQIYFNSAIPNSFFYFFRAEGKSDKKEGNRGRWGIGKQVFPRSSRISTLLGFTIRASDKKSLLMGHTILRNHTIGEDQYSPDGYLGEVDPDRKPFMLPIYDKQEIEKFRKDFNIRRVDEPGLSVVVPYLDPEISSTALLRALIYDYYFPILNRELEVKFESPEDSFEINAANFLEIMNKIDPDDEIRSIVNFSRWIVINSDTPTIEIDLPKIENLIWMDEFIDDEKIKILQERLEKGMNIYIKVNMWVPNENRMSPAFFNIFLCREGNKNIRPIFVREGIIIPDNRTNKIPGIRSLVQINEGPLATLLGDSEGPAHTQWQNEGLNFRNKYKNGGSYIKFITNIVSNINSLLASRQEEENKNLLADIFSIPTEEGEVQEVPIDDTSTNDGQSSQKPRPKIESKKRNVEIEKTLNGFKIALVSSDVKLPFDLDVWAAYDIRRNNPLIKYDINDFTFLNKDLIKIQSFGAKIVLVENNHISLVVTQPDFQLSVMGFDENRDIFIKAI